MVVKHIVIPMAGEGQRFRNEGYTISKPSLPLPNVFRHGETTSMVVGAIDSMTSIYETANVHLVHRDFHIQEGVIAKLKSDLPNVKTYELKQLTEGQAVSCAVATHELPEQDEMLVGACDSGFVVDKNKFEEATKNADAVVFVFKNNPIVEANPKAYGWVEANAKGQVTKVSVKKPISDNPTKDYAVCGSFWFKNVGTYNRLLKKMMDLNLRVNNEFYIDELMNVYLMEKLRVNVIQVDMLFCWGTPKEYEDYKSTYAYWNEFLQEEKAN